MIGTLVQVNVSPGGMPKLPVDSAPVTRDGVGEDWQLNRKYHGGCDRAVCLFSEEQYAGLRTRHGIDLVNGSIGENFTTAGIDLSALKPGDRLSVGESVIQITSVRVPCRSLHKWDPRLMNLIKGNSGWLARVLRSGTVRPGDSIRLLPATVPEVSRG